MQTGEVVNFLFGFPLVLFAAKYSLLMLHRGSHNHPVFEGLLFSDASSLFPSNCMYSESQISVFSQ